MSYDVLRVLDELGIDYHVSGDEANARCPRHQGQSMNWYINTDTGLFQCFKCDYRGPLVRLVRDLRRVGEDEALLWVRTRSSFRLRASPDPEEAPEPEAPKVTEASLWRFGLPPERQLRKRNISAESCEALGILWDVEESAWILTIRDSDGVLAGWQSKGTGRDKRVRNHPKGIKKSGYLFGLHAVSGETAILVESPLDVARLRDAGYPWGVASFGVRLSRRQLDLLARHFKSVVFALDNDEDGWDQSEKLRKEFHRIPARFFDYESADRYRKDPGDMEDWEIEAAVMHAIPSMIARF